MSSELAYFSAYITALHPQNTETKPHILGFHRHATEYIPEMGKKNIHLGQVKYSSSFSNLKDHIKTSQLITPTGMTMSK